MTWDLSNDEIEQTTAMSAEDRYAYFIDKTIEHEQIWSLRNEEGWVLGEATDDIEAIPVWPHPKYAEACATGPWANHDAESIDLKVFIERFIPGMMRDKRVLAVFEVTNGSAIVVDPDAVAYDLDISVDD